MKAIQFWSYKDPNKSHKNAVILKPSSKQEGHFGCFITNKTSSNVLYLENLEHAHELKRAINEAIVTGLVLPQEIIDLYSNAQCNTREELNKAIQEAYSGTGV